MGILCSSCAKGESSINVTKKKKLKRKKQDIKVENDAVSKANRAAKNTKQPLDNWESTTTEEEIESKEAIMPHKKRHPPPKKSRTKLDTGSPAVKALKKNPRKTRSGDRPSQESKSRHKLHQTRKTVSETTKDKVRFQGTSKQKSTHKAASNRPKKHKRQKKPNTHIQKTISTSEQHLIQASNFSSPEHLHTCNELNNMLGLHRDIATYQAEYPPDYMQGDGNFDRDEPHYSPTEIVSTYGDSPRAKYEDHHLAYYSKYDKSSPEGYSPGHAEGFQSPNEGLDTQGADLTGKFNDAHVDYSDSYEKSSPEALKFHSFRPPGTDFEVLVGLRHSNDGSTPKDRNGNKFSGATIQRSSSASDINHGFEENLVSRGKSSPYSQLRLLNDRNQNASGFIETESLEPIRYISSQEIGSEIEFLNYAHEENISHQEEDYPIILPLKKPVGLNSVALSNSDKMDDMFIRRLDEITPKSIRQATQKPDIQNNKMMLEAENHALQKIQSLQDFGVDLNDLQSLNASLTEFPSLEPSKAHGWAQQNVAAQEEANADPELAAARCMEELKAKLAEIHKKVKPGDGIVRLDHPSDQRQLSTSEPYLSEYGGHLKNRNPILEVKKWPTVMSPPRKRRVTEKGFPVCPPGGIDVLSYHISQSEFSTLKDPGNPDEKVIMAYLRLEAQNTSTYVMEREVIDSWRHGLDLLPTVLLCDYDKLIGPFDPIRMRFGAPGNWILFYANTKYGTMSILDSRCESHEHRHQDQFDYFMKFWEKRREKRIAWKEKIMKCGQQQDNVSDGMFCMLHGLCIIRGQKPSSVKQKNIDKFRLHIAQKLLRNINKPDKT